MDKKHLAACHCRVAHDELSLKLRDGNTKSFRTDPQLKDSMDYVDVSCDDEGKVTGWKDIGSGSKDYIWPIGCPVYFLPDDDEKPMDMVFNALNDLLVHGWRILKPGGKIMIVLTQQALNFTTDVVPKIKKFNEKYAGNLQWTFETVNKEDLDFIVEKTIPITKPIKYLILTKPISAGRRRKTRRNRKSKTQRRR